MDKDLGQIGSQLMIQRGPSLHVLRSIARQTGAVALFANRRFEPMAARRDEQIWNALRADGLQVETFNASLLFEPESVRTKEGKPFKMFTPFWRVCRSLPEPARPLPAPDRLPEPPRWPLSLSLPDLELEPKVDWVSGLHAVWSPGSGAAAKKARAFVDGPLTAYDNDRDRPEIAGTSGLSPHLHFGEISVRAIWHLVRDHAESSVGTGYLRQLGWREFAHHVLWNFPDTADQPMRAEFADFPWRSDPGVEAAWQRGRTGYPLVDAGMRQLWETGWMHNRVRMVVASLLVKHLLVPWQNGARWFWDTLVDADLANNTMGWQWTAGCGADAAPYFRIFNPVVQGRQHDPEGEYVRRWVPELRRLPTRWIHSPWEAPQEVLDDASIVLDDTYPQPVVEHGFARRRALEALETMKTRKEATP